MHNTKGFTLLELLIVVAIIGVLAAVGIPMYNGYITDTKIAVAKKNFDTVVALIESEIYKCAAVGGVLNLLDKTGAPKTAPCPSFSGGSLEGTGSGARAVHAGIMDHLEGIGMKNPYDNSKAVTKSAAFGYINVGGHDTVISVTSDYRDADGASQRLAWHKYLVYWQ